MSSLFVSLSSIDKERALNFFQIFETAVRGVYFDAYFRAGRSMPQGFHSVEDNRIKTAAGIVLALSTNWLRSLPCRREYISALVQERAAVVIPVQIGDIDESSLNAEQLETWREIRSSHGQCYDLRKLWRGSIFEPTPDFSLNTQEHGHDAIELATRFTPFSVDGGATNTFEQRRERYRVEKQKRPETKPYKGLLPYTERDESFFFGRDKEIVQAVRELDHAVRTRGANFFFVSGPSGAGKSSFMRAGILPQLYLRRRDYVVLPTVEASKLNVWQDLIEKLSSAEGIELGVKPLQVEPGSDGDVAASEVQRALIELAKMRGEGSWSRNPHTGDLFGPTIVIPIDQAEDLLLLSEKTDPATRGISERGKHKLIALIHDMCRLGPFAIIATTREAARSQLVHELCGSFLHVPFDLGDVSDEAAFKAIVEEPPRLFPSEKRIDDSLWIRLRTDFFGDKGGDRLIPETSLPLVAFTIQRLFDHSWSSAPRNISLDDYKKAGTIQTTISRVLQTCRKIARDQRPDLFAIDEDLHKLKEIARPDQDQDYVAEVILYGLVTVDPVSRAFVEKRLFLADAQQSPELLTVIKALNHADCRLVTEKGDGPNKYYALSHLSIIDNVKDWYGRSRLIVELHSAVADVKYLADAWHQGGRREELLGALPHQLEQIHQVETNTWLQAELLNDSVLTDFVQAVRLKLEAEASSKTQLLKLVGAQKDTLTKSRRERVAERIVLGTALVLLTASAIAAGIWMQTYATASTLLTRAEFHLARHELLETQTLLASHDLDFFRRDLPWPFNGLNDRMALLVPAASLNVKSAMPDRKLGQGDPNKVAMNSGNAVLIERPGALVRWDFEASGPGKLTEFTLPGSAPTGIRTNESGSLVAFADIYDGVVMRIGGAAGDGRASMIRGLTLRPDLFAFSSGSDIVAAAAPDRRVGVWRIPNEGGEAERLLIIDKPSPQTAATSLTVSSDGQLLAVGREQGRIRGDINVATVSYFRVSETEKVAHSALGLSGTITALAFDPSGQTLVAFDDTGKGCAWDIENQSRCFSLRGHERPAILMLFDKSRSIVFSIDTSGTVIEHDYDKRLQGRRWDVQSAGVRQAAFSSDGRRIFMLDGAGCLHILEISSLSEPSTICERGAEAISSWRDHGVSILVREPDGFLKVVLLPLS